MNKSIPTARCHGKKAIEIRSRHFKSANAAGKAMDLDPKTVRQIENGVAVRLTNIQTYAGKLFIPIESILIEEDLLSVQESRVVLDYIGKDLFRSSALSGISLCDKYMTIGVGHGLPCDARSFINLLSKMNAGSKPIWEKHKSIPTSAVDLPAILKGLQQVILKIDMDIKLDLDGIISQLNTERNLTNVFQELNDACGAHILGCTVTSHLIEEVMYEDQYILHGTDVYLPFFVIASTKVREFKLKYEQSLSEENYVFQQDLVDHEDRPS